MFTVSINPTTLCNFKCDFCYLTQEQLRNKQKLDLSILDTKLKEISQYYKIDHFDVYGGEVTLLPNDYMEDLLDLLETYTSSINIITNLSRSINHSPWLLRDNVTISVSWDYFCREKWDVVLRNIIETPKQIHILMLMSRCMHDWSYHDIEEAANILNSVGNIVSVEIKPYSSNQSNDQNVTNKQFEEFILKWIQCDPKIYRKYEFINENNILSSLQKTRNVWSNDHVYIMPDGNFAVLEFDDNDNEFFMPLDTIDEYCAWTKTEYSRVYNNKICKNCEYFGHCLSEHLRDVKDLTDSCNGFKFLLDKFNERL